MAEDPSILTVITMLVMAGAVLAALGGDIAIMVARRSYARARQRYDAQLAAVLNPGEVGPPPLGLPEPPRPPFRARWSLADPFLAVQVSQVVAVGAALAILPAARYALSAASIAAAEMHPAMLTFICVQDILFLVLALRYIRRYETPFASIGLVRPRLIHLIVGALIGAALLVVAGMFIGLLLQALPHPAVHAMNASERELDGSGATPQSALPAFHVIYAVLGCTLVPICEETFFRGFLYNSLRRRYPLWLAVLASAFLFSIAHVSALHALMVFPLGIGLALAYEYSGSIWVGVAMHAANNLIVFSVLKGS